MYDDKKWFSQKGLASLMSAQQEPTCITRTMVAAYKQRTAVGILLGILDGQKLKLSEEEKELLEKVRKQHAKYMIEGGE